MEFAFFIKFMVESPKRVYYPQSEASPFYDIVIVWHIHSTSIKIQIQPFTAKQLRITKLFCILVIFFEAVLYNIKVGETTIAILLYYKLLTE